MRFCHFRLKSDFNFWDIEKKILFNSHKKFQNDSLNFGDYNLVNIAIIQLIEINFPPSQLVVNLSSLLVTLYFTYQNLPFTHVLLS